MQAFRLARGLAWLAVLGACQTDSFNAPSGTTPDNLAAKLQGAAARMHARFGAARRLEEAIARSDIDRTHEEARSIGALDEPDVLPRWQPYFAAVAETAHEIATAPDVMSAARQAAVLGLRCAQCHTAANARIAFAPEPNPADAPRRGPTMAAHHWAAVQMWTGLIGPSDDRWRAGAEALTSVPLTLVAEVASPASDVDVDDVAKVRLQARRALELPAQDVRADIFGSLLATCAHCHATLRDR